MGTIDEALLDEKLAELERVRTWSPGVLATLEELLHAPDEWALSRANPFAFAAERDVSASEALDLFLHAARLGVFTMDWHLLCPQCGAAVESFASLRKLHRHLFCALCLVQTDANLDDYIQVTFTVAPSIRRIAAHDQLALSAEDYVYRLRFTPEMRMPGPDGVRVVDALQPIIPVATWIRPGDQRSFHLDLTAGAISAAEFTAHTGASVDVVDDATTSRIDLTIEETTITASTERVRPGPIEVSVTSRRSSPFVMVIAHKSNEMLAMGRPAVQLDPIVTGATLLTNQTFRRIFRGETLQGAEGIGVRDVTVLFTDLKGSTALYERIGDLRAFALVNQHFDRLAAVIAAHDGAIVKTIGDAVMAAFTRPSDAVRAALEMRRQIARFNREQGAEDVLLKIGVHRGPSIAVTLNESLDYFGHTVNVAARVQGLAGADEIYVTDDVYRADGVAALLGTIESQDVQLRGIQKEVRVHRVAAP
jgi:class 3 adenylate cyclase